VLPSSQFSWFGERFDIFGKKSLTHDNRDCTVNFAEGTKDMEDGRVSSTNSSSVTRLMHLHRTELIALLREVAKLQRSSPQIFPISKTTFVSPTLFSRSRCFMSFVSTIDRVQIRECLSLRFPRIHIFHSRLRNPNLSTSTALCQGRLIRRLDDR